MTELLHGLVLACFWGATVALGVYGLHLLVLLRFFHRRASRCRDQQAEIVAAYRRLTPAEQWPTVTTQIPLYNEADVAERVIDAVCGFDYPAGKHDIQVLDDSDDQTAGIVCAAVRRWQSRGVAIRVVHRNRRAGYKAGALAAGVARTDSDFISIFDADFVPPADFLRRTIPLLAGDDRLACVQARWDHINSDESWLTRAQALGLDVHFGVEQGARAWNGLIMNFNGTAGVWRRAAIVDPAVGGWSGDTLTEDLDLSYRTQLAGWRHDYCFDLPCPAELPADIWAFKAQQRRWATGSIQTARKLLPRIWRSRLRMAAKIEATIHLTQHSAAIWMLLLALVARPVVSVWQLGNVPYEWLWPAWAVLLAAAIAPWITYVCARHAIKGGWEAVGLLPRVVIIGIGLAASNACAVVRGLFSRGGEFVRTPKSGSFGRARRPSRYRALQDRLWLIELGLGAYSVWCLVLNVGAGRWMFSFFLSMYAVSFLTIGWLSRPSWHWQSDGNREEAKSAKGAKEEVRTHFRPRASSSSRSRTRARALSRLRGAAGRVLLTALAVWGALSCDQRQSGSATSAPAKPAPVDAEKLAHLRNAALAYMEAGLFADAIPYLDELATLLPDEPMVFANRSLSLLHRTLAANLNEDEKAALLQRAETDVERAARTSGGDARVRLIRAGLAIMRIQPELAVPLLQEAVNAAPDNYRIRYALVEQSKSLADAGQALRLEHLEALAKSLPNNLAVRLLAAEQAIDLRRGEDTLRHLDSIDAMDMAWPAQGGDSRERFEAARRALRTGDVAAGLAPVKQVINLLRPRERYQVDLKLVKPEEFVVGEPIYDFRSTSLPLRSTPPRDHEVRFRQLAAPRHLSLAAIGAAPLDVAWLEDRAETPPLLVSADNDNARVYERTLDGRYTDPIVVLPLTEAAAHALAKPGAGAGQETSGPKAPTSVPAASPSGGVLVAADWNHDARGDLVYGASDGKVYLLAQAPDFLAIAGAEARPPRNHVVELPEARPDASTRWILPFDADQDGDLDLFIGRRGARPALLRYNGDETFSETAVETGLAVDGAPGLVAGDIGDMDDDGDLDLLAVDESDRLRWFDNRRAGKFVAVDPPADAGPVRALTIADLNNDGRLDLAALAPDGGLSAIVQTADSRYVRTAVGTIKDAAEVGTSTVQCWDYDNDGWLDLLVTHGGKLGIWRNRAFATKAPEFTNAREIAPQRLFDPPAQYANQTDWGRDVNRALPCDADRDGDLDLLLTFADGRTTLLDNDGGNRNHWYNVQLRAFLLGDQRNNSFGVGSSIETRAGRTYQRRMVRGAVTHLGMGDADHTDTIRIVWPNGFPQHVILPKADVPIVEVQRLKGSCPFLLAWDGTQFAFVTDLIWRSPLGMRINGQVVASPVTTQDYVKIRADQLEARDGRYELKIIAALWETMFVDEVKLMCVDHPVDVEVFVDERFTAPEPLPFVIYAIPNVRPVRSAVDQRGVDVTEIVTKLDGQHLGEFAKGKYQGIAEDHYVEVDIGPLPANQRVCLLASGWIHPTDSSLNVAIGQGANVQPTPLTVWVADGRGGWTAAVENAGFPAGKHKTCVFDLTGKFANDDHRVRLRTNLEIYWDRLAVGLGEAPQHPTVTTLSPAAAEIGWFGVPAMSPRDATSPELPDLDDVAPRSPWRDLVGWYTRFGDVRELLATTDDRYVIQNAGDEIALTFTAPAPPPAGWTRDFILFSDGWVKDGDWNTVDSMTVGPLPHHAMKTYPYPPNDAPPTLRSDHSDWETYHTRYVAPIGYGRRLSPE